MDDAGVARRRRRRLPPKVSQVFFRNAQAKPKKKKRNQEKKSRPCLFDLVSYYARLTFGPLSLYPLFVSVPFFVTKKKGNHQMKLDDDLLDHLTVAVSSVWSPSTCISRLVP